MKESGIEEDINRINCIFEFQEKMGCQYVLETEDERAIKHLLSDYKRVLKENETYKKQYFCLIDKIENKIDKFDYEFEKAKRKNYQERADYYWDLIRNFKKLLESEE